MTFHDNIRIIILLLSTIFFISCHGRDEEDMLYNSKINVGDKLPEFFVKTLDDKEIGTKSLIAQGKTVMLVFFSTTCKDCQLQLPVIDALVKECQDGIVCLCIGRNQSVEDINDYWKRNAYSMTCSPQNDDLVYKLFADKGIPRIYIADNSGIVQYVSTPEVFLSLPELREILNLLP